MRTNVMRRGRSALAVALVAAWVANAQAEPATTVRGVDLKQQPAADAATLLSIPANTLVELVKREGAWVQLKFGPSLGWAKLFDVRLGDGAAQAAAPAANRSRSIGQVLGLASGSRSPTVTTGVRGLDEDASGGTAGAQAPGPSAAPAAPAPTGTAPAAPRPAAGGRVLDAETLSKAVPNASEMSTLESFAASKEQAQAFAKQGRLEARNVEPLKSADAGVGADRGARR